MRVIAKAQRDLTHKETLKAVGEWIKHLTRRDESGERVYFVGEIFLKVLDLQEVLLRGEMPEEVK